MPRSFHFVSVTAEVYNGFGAHFGSFLGDLWSKWPFSAEKGEGVAANLYRFATKLEAFPAKLRGFAAKLEGFPANLYGFAEKLRRFGANGEGFPAKLEGFAAKLEADAAKLAGAAWKLEGILADASTFRHKKSAIVPRKATNMPVGQPSRAFDNGVAGRRVMRLHSGVTAKGRQRGLWALSLALWYVVFGFFIAPRLIKAVVLWQLPEQIGRQVTLQKVKTNPFTISLALDGFAITESDGKPFVGWDEVYVNLDPTGLLKRQLVLSQIAISNAFGHVQVNKDGSFNFSDILLRHPSVPRPVKKATGKPLVISVGQLRITGSKVVYDDLTRATPFSTTVGPIDVTLNEFSTSPDSKNPYGFTAITESGEKLSWRGYFYLVPIWSEGEFAVENIMLKKYAPFYDELLNLTLHDGRLDVRSNYRVEFTDKLTVAQLSNAVVKLTALKVAERDATNDVMELAGMTVRGIDFNLIAQTVVVDSFTATGGRIAVRKLDDGLPNLARMFMKDKPATASVTTNAPTPTKPWTLTLREMRADDHAGTATGFFGNQATGCREFRLTNLHLVTEPMSASVDDITVDGVRLDAVIPAGLTNLFAHAATSTNAPAPAKESAPLPVIRIGSFTVTNGVTTFTDQSLQTPAGVVVTGLNVRVTNISTDTNGVTDLHVAARVDNVAPVDVTGRINPFAPDATTAMQVALHGIDLVPVGGYSGKYAGYLIRKGKLSVEMKYDIQQRALKASNNILVDQFTFGEKTDSPDALKLPVKLAVAILKDVNGQIKIDVPIEGRTDDPKFRYWPAVWHVLGGLFTKIFTAPFSMIGSMFGGGGEELSYQEFAPGSSALASNETKKLDVLVKALTERPALNLEITGSIDPVKDIEPLKRVKLHELAGTNYAAGVRALYAAALPKLAPPPPPPPAFTSNISNLLPPGAKRAEPEKLTGSSAKKAAAELTVEEMEQQYLPLVELTAEDYRRLASARVASVVAHLKENGHLGDERLFISNNPNVPVATTGARAIFGLQ